MKLAGLSMAGIAMLLSAGAAQATTVFDTQALTAATPGESVYQETRGSDFNYAALLQFSQDVTVNQIGVFTAVDNAQDIKFLIFESAYQGGSGTLLFSQTKSFGMNTTQQFIYTDPMSFTFLAGHTYDVGILGSTGNLTGTWSGFSNLTANGVTELSQNANFRTYATPTTGQYSGVTPFIQLNDIEAVAVPEPSSWAMMVIGVGAVGFAVRRRRAAGATFG